MQGDRLPRERVRVTGYDSDNLVGWWEDFFTKYYPEAIHNFGRNFAGNPRIIVPIHIDFKDVVNADRSMADLLINNFAQVHGGMSAAISTMTSNRFPGVIAYNEDINIRISGITHKTPVKMLRHEHLGKFIAINGIVRNASTTGPRYVRAVYQCVHCHTPTEPIEQHPYQIRVEPHQNCIVCQRKTKMVLSDALSRKVDCQYIKVQESPEGMSGGEQPQIIDVDITEELCGKVFAGDHVVINGILKSIPKTLRGRPSPNLTTYIAANNVEVREKQFSEIRLTEDERQQIEVLSQEPDLFERLIGSYAPSIYGHEEEKMAILLQMAGGVPKINPDGSKTRGDSHVILVGDPSCVSAGTLVTMADGTFRRIETLSGSVGKKVMLDRRGAYDKHAGVIGNFFHHRMADTLQIITETGKKIDVTPDHPLWYYREEKTGVWKTRHFEKKWVPAKDLKVGDHVKTITKIPCLKKAYVPLEFTEFGHKDVKLPKVCDEKLAWLWGYLTGDGSIHRTNEVPYRIYLYFNHEELDTMDKYIKDFRDIFGEEPSIAERVGDTHVYKGKEFRSKNICTNVAYNSRTIVSFFDMYLSKERVVPDCILASKDSVISSFLSGLFEADGCVFTSQSKDRSPKGYVQLKSASNRLLRDVQVMLLRFGIQSRINTNNIMIRKQSDIIRFADAIGFISSKKKKSLADAVSTASEFKKHLRSHVGYERIVSIEPSGKQDVYDIEVPDHHRFISDGIVSHNTAKSKLIKYATLIAPRGIYTSGESSTKAGLTATAVKDETGDGRWSIEAGAFVLGDGGIVIVDEFDKMDETDRTAMHSVMEGQTVDISKAGITASMNARCSILAAANPKLTRFDPMAPIADQINLPPTILTRFDLIFPVSDVPEINRDTMISSHILKLHAFGEKRARGMTVSTDEAGDILPVLDPAFLRKYISHSKTIIPMMNAEAREEIQTFYLRIRGQYDATKTVPITARQLEALIRLTEASARLRLSVTVEKQDVERVIGLVMFSLNKVAYDTEKGVFDSDMISGVSTGRREMLSFIDDIIEKYDPHTKTIKHQDLVRELINAGRVRNDLDADKKIQDLIHATLLMELPHKMYRKFR